MAVRQFIILAVLSIILGLGANLISPNKIDVIGNYRDISNGNGPVVPPTAEEGDPPFVDMARASVEYASGSSIFIDAREEGEFECGTIPGSVNIPFEYMPDGDLTGYIDSCLSEAPTDRPLVVFCSGEECDLSLHLGRNLVELGYNNVLIFFGGSREWETNGFEIERRVDCDN